MRRPTREDILITAFVLGPLLPFERVAEIQQGAVLTFTLLFLGAVALAVVAGLLLGNEKPETNFDDRPPQLAKRGTYVHYVIGRRLVTMQPVWVGRRELREETVSGGKKGPLGGGGPSQTVYYEDGIHVICLGPASALHSIRKGSEVIFEGPITPDDTPSGTELVDTEGNTFAIYWGFESQPINTRWATDIGVSSTWPFYCYVHWYNRKLGTSATWPQMDYEIECKCVGLRMLPDSNCDVPNGDPDLSEPADIAKYGGANTAHILYQLISAAYPHGAGIQLDYDWESLRALGVLAESEGLGHNTVLRDGQSLRDLIANILADARTLMVEEQGKLAFVPLREDDTAIDLLDNLLVVPDATFEIEHGDFSDNRAEFLHPDIDNEYLEAEIPIADDAPARYLTNRKNRQVRMESITNQYLGAQVADQRKQIQIADNNQIKLKANRTMRRLAPGHLVNVSGIGQLRVTEVQKNPNSGRAEITASINQYSLVDSGWQPGQDPPPDTGTVSTPDDFVAVVEVPRAYSGDNTISIAVIRGRADGQAPPARVLVSLDDVTFSLLGEEGSVGAYGTLTGDEFDYSHPDAAETPLDLYSRWIDSGPVLTASAANQARILDLSESLAEYLTERQCLLVGDEIMSLRYVDAIDASSVRLRGISRAQLYTAAAPVSAVDLPVCVFRPEALSQFTSTAWDAFTTIYVKVVPQGVAGSAVDSIPVRLTGKARGLLPPLNIDYPLTVANGANLELTWDYRSLPGATTSGSGLPGAASGELSLGTPHEPDTTSVQGEMVVEVYNSPEDAANPLVSPVNTFRSPDVTSTGFTYTGAQRTTDGLDDVLMGIKIVNEISGVQAYPRIIGVNT